MKKELFKKIIRDNQEYIPARLPRELELPLDSSKIISLIGSRRSGKTSVFYHTIHKLRTLVPAEGIVYISFDDDRMFDFTLNDFQTLIDAYYEMYPSKKGEIVYYFFDEIQNIPNWELFVRRIYDTEKCRIFLTGSSSRLLTKEIATGLRGRTITYTLFPLSFTEYLSFKSVKADIYSSAQTALIRNELNNYLETGGFPELLLENDLKEKILREYIDMIIYKDLIERYNVSNLFLIKYLVKYCFTNISTLLSINRVYNILTSMGKSVSKNTLYDYFGYLEDAMILYQIPVFSDSASVQQRNSKKMYVVDIGLKKAISFEEDRGKIFENIVFNQLKRSYDDIYYFKNGQEVDFVFMDKGKPHLINVSRDIDNAETYKREVDGLFAAMKQLNLKESLLITDYQEKEEIIEGTVIHIVPLWKWLIQ
ncbi:MAG TPA: ATP-binding protein [Bacteroidales bacterium]|nr:ATP-binding protein [Bacteroidales bacterium]HOE04357.1 ATP-binding protein [Bacteroidales bacterium]